MQVIGQIKEFEPEASMQCAVSAGRLAAGQRSVDVAGRAARTDDPA
ncbi:hypothetical protein ACTMU2_00925 [Cupriavidus basilensis]